MTQLYDYSLCVTLLGFQNVKTAHEFLDSEVVKVTANIARLNFAVDVGRLRGDAAKIIMAKHGEELITARDKANSNYVPRTKTKKRGDESETSFGFDTVSDVGGYIPTAEDLFKALEMESRTNGSIKVAMKDIKAIYDRIVEGRD